MTTDTFTWFDKDGNLITGPACEQPVGKRRYDPRVHAVWKPSGIALHQAYTSCGSSVFEILDGAQVDCPTCIAVLEQPETDRMAAFLTARLAEEPAERARDVAAKRELLARFSKMDNIRWGYLEMRFAVRLAASVYAEHADYEGAWEPIWHRKDWE